MENTMKMYITADEVAELLGVSRGYAYKVSVIGNNTIPYNFFNGLKAFICMFFDVLSPKMNNGITKK